MTHVKIQTLNTPEGTIGDTGTTYTGDTGTLVETTVPANGAGANAVALAFAATDTLAGIQSLGLLATVPCVVTLTGATAIDGVAIGTVTLVANQLRHVTTIVGAVTAVSVGANTTGAGAAGTIKISALYYT